MAIFHFSARAISRSSGGSAVRIAAYNSRDKLKDLRTGKTHDYSNREDLIRSGMIFPDNVAEWMKRPEQLWNKIEEIEKRKDAQLCREVEISIPKELTEEQGINLIREYVKSTFVDRGMIAQVSVHNDPNNNNPHAHILLTLREIKVENSEITFGNKCREWNSKKNLEKWRSDWQSHANKALEDAGHNIKIDCRTLEKQGIDRKPQIHVGSIAMQIYRRGKISDKFQQNESIKNANKIRKQPQPKLERTPIKDLKLKPKPSNSYSRPKKNQLEM
jgi:ATP-dependent exoDNAse (exonuclease V) alpha subunit